MFNILKFRNIKRRDEEDVFYKIFIVFLIYGVIYFFLFKPLTIGTSFNYKLITIYLPIIFGLLVLLLLKWKLLKKVAKTASSKLDAFFSYLLLFVIGLMLSYSSLGVTSEIVFHLVSTQKAKENRQTIFIIPVEKVNSFHRKNLWRERNIAFKLNNHYEKFEISSGLYNKIKDIGSDNMDVKIICREGFFGVYYVDNWDIIHPEDNCK